MLRISAAVTIVVTSLLLTATTSSLFAQSGGDDRAIRQFFVDSDAAWNAHNAQQLTNPGTTVADADFINVYGGWTKGRDSFLAIMSQLQAGPFHDVTRHTVVEKIRFVRPDVAVVIITNVDRRGEGPPNESRATLVLSKEQGHWLLDSFQNTQVTAVPEPLRTPPTNSNPPQ